MTRTANCQVSGPAVELATRRLAEWMNRPEHAKLLARIHDLIASVPHGTIQTPTAIRMTLLQHVGPLGVEEGDKMELLVILLETALWMIDWALIAELTSVSVASSSSLFASGREPPTGIESS